VLSASLSSVALALPGQGPIAVGGRIISSRSSRALFRSVVHEVVALGDGSPGSGPAGTCSLRRFSDGDLLRDSEGQSLWFPTNGLTPAGGSLEGNAVHLALLLQCPWEFVQAIIKRAPEALSKLDALGRTPLTVAAEVIAAPPKQ
jgi:hypothetical protein